MIFIPRIWTSSVLKGKPAAERTIISLNGGDHKATKLSIPVCIAPKCFLFNDFITLFISHSFSHSILKVSPRIPIFPQSPPPPGVGWDCLRGVSGQVTLSAILYRRFILQDPLRAVPIIWLGFKIIVPYQTVHPQNPVPVSLYGSVLSSSISSVLLGF